LFSGIWTQKPTVRGLIPEPPNRRKAEVDGGRGVVRLFEADPVAGDYGPVESEPGLRAVPVNELADGVIIRPLGTLRREAV